MYWKPVCEECKDTNIDYDCGIHWDDSKRCLVIGELRDTLHYCANCDTDIKIEWLQIEE